ncbi:phosphoesterase family-domain-containing protein [Jimgerdemannia flammicorona]|uniref:Phosphoesterase family-domain-containing protein n=1 Tax=Jimgerdemannia flammicorona TaxID=994334 RepID=A0A433QJH7_9FUNG|nr:phosphoesterase family-domain-containing protein [Jimgerdemannia flammicorona]
MVRLASLAVLSSLSGFALASGKWFDHVVTVFLENTDFDQAKTQAYWQSLAARGILLTQYGGVTHPSLPNYLAVAAGTTFGILDDAHYDINAIHIGDFLEAKNVTWKTYQEDYPGDFTYCFVADNTPAPLKLYRRKHNPFISFSNVNTNTSRCTSHIVNSKDLDADIANNAIPDYSFYIPNMINDGHDSNTLGNVSVMTNWLENFLEPKLNNSAFSNTLFVITFDESDVSNDEGNKGTNYVYTVLIGSAVKVANVADATQYTHFNLLATIEANWDLGSLGRNDSVVKNIIGLNGTALPNPYYNETLASLQSTNAGAANTVASFGITVLAVLAAAMLL